MKKILLITGLILSVLLLSGCQTRDHSIWCKHGTVVKINEGVIFGGTFTDWRDDIYFSDGTVLWSQEKSLFGIELNRSGRFFFEKNYFTYDGCEYKFDNFVRVEYDDETYT
jgi:hypothetical protein